MIDPNFFSNPIDVDVMLETVKFVRGLGYDQPLKDKIVEELLPGPQVATDEDLREYIHKYASTLWHPVGSCAMRPRDDGGVINDKLVVHGTANIRVVDASSIPILMSGHPQATVLGYAEKAADLIKAAGKL